MMKAYTYIDKGLLALQEKPEPRILDPKDAIVKVTLASICTSDLHIKHGVHRCIRCTSGRCRCRHQDCRPSR